MKSYKDFAKESIGSSDIGALVLVGGGAGDIQNQFLFLAKMEATGRIWSLVQT